MPAWGLGVDLGTSFSAAAIAVGDRVEILEVGRERRIPSTVLLDDAGRLLAGSLAQRLTGRSPERAERNPKRYVGRGPMLLGGNPVEARDALAALLELFVAEGCTRFDGARPAAVVLTHPVAWGEDRRAVLRAAGAAVVPDATVHLIEEPVAAAVHYTVTHNLADGGRVAVYDLGGGTFDSAVLAGRRGQFAVVGKPGGDDQIGGESFDERVYEHFGAQLAQRVPQWWEQVSSSAERRWLAAAADLLGEARTAKEALSEYDTASQYISGADVDVEISRTELHDLIGADIMRTADILDETIRQSQDDTGGTAGLAGVFLTGGASRMPLVQQTLRARYGAQVRTWDDPKIVVALGAARIALTHVGAQPAQPVATTASRPAADEQPRRNRPAAAVSEPEGDEFEVRLDGVVEAIGTGRDIYAWCRGPSNSVDVLHRIDPGTGMPDRQLALGRVTDWAASDEGLLVADRFGPAARLHTLSPALVIRSTRPVQTAEDPVVLAAGGVGWAFLRPFPSALVDNSIGLPWGQTGALSVIESNLTGVFVHDNLPREVGDSARWYVNEDNALRRLFDQGSPTESEPMLAYGKDGCVVILGRYSSKAPMGANYRRPGGYAKGRHQAVQPYQVVCRITPGAEIRHGERRTGNWLYQAVHHLGQWHLATEAGLETGALQGDGVLLASRPRSGALRWFLAGDRMYAIGMEQVLPARGLWIAVLEHGRLRTLFQNSDMALLGHLTSRERAEQPRVTVDGNGLWVAGTEGDGRTQVLHVTPQGVRPVHSASGWLEPVARLASGLLCLHDPQTQPGVARTSTTNLVLLPH
ncbi:Hsp70 family protein [Dactylosporangium sp. AC04546]|uniref:Hsp70 family protein n=1 Tax=Dactylosporangium sp. AC04546 TaxID=2862460 RepID=UPI001EDD44C1|nr:Hsp70 family protein [Dactylosporangium sp. AC04546]WVK87098.1 Hsp70 family protein [Dactylosporangium sp. AC04546]